MNTPKTFARMITLSFISVYIMLSITFLRPFFGGALGYNLIAGLVLSAASTPIFFYLESLCRKYSLRIWGTITLGLFAGIFLGKALETIYESLLLSAAAGNEIAPYLLTYPKTLIYLFSIHLAVSLILVYQEELHLSIPFIRFHKTTGDEKNIILDEHALGDPRIFDFLSTGILNNKVIIPTFITKDLKRKLELAQSHSGGSIQRIIAAIDKIKEIKNLNVKENETDFSDLTDIRKKIHRLAKVTGSNILTAECSKISKEPDEVEYIGINHIANALKNIMSTGESIEIKVQRYGKEPKQGVGYLEDGTMVVINNGGSFVGEVIETRVISVKQTSAGRIIFTNALVEEEEPSYAYESYEPHETV
ncbi:hypothetical protein K0U07_03900 [bacterium]|nr:hypothetical protein [bacterium]